MDVCKQEQVCGSCVVICSVVSIQFIFFLFPYSFVTLFEISTQLGGEILLNSNHILPICDEALVQAQRNLLETEAANSLYKYAVKLNIHARMTGR